MSSENFDATTQPNEVRSFSEDEIKNFFKKRFKEIKAAPPSNVKLVDKDEDGNWFHDWENLDNDLIKDMFHWISIEDEQLEAMTKKEKKQFVLAMEKHLRRTQKFLGVE